MGGIVSGVSDLFGGASNNAGFQAQAAPLVNPLAPGQLTAAQGTATGGLNQQQGLINALQGQGAQGINSQANLTGALTNEMNGVGPNPAQAALAQNTGQNIAAQAALMAGQRGGSANAGLLARQIGQQGAGIQQNAVGQAATLGAQQQLAAQQQLQQLAGTQIGQQQGAVTNLNNAALTNQGQLLGALGGYNSNLVGSTSSQNSANSGLAQTNANNSAKAISSLGSGVLPFLAKGGEISGNLDGKSILAKALSKKQMPDHLRAMAQIYHPKVLKLSEGGDVDQPIPNQSGGGGDGSSEVSELAPLLATMAASKGAVVPGNPKNPGKNTVKNDVVPAMLTPKEIVLPLSVTQSKNPGEAAKAFVEHIKGKDSDADFKQAIKKHMANRKAKK